MIAKIIQMNRAHRRAVDGHARRHVRQLSDGLFALMRYVVDADPHSLIADAAHDILSISDYSMATKDAGIDPGEKVEAFGTRNLHTDDLSGWQAEMLAVASRAPKVKRPVIHIVISLKENETWSEHQREEAITIVLRTLGLERCQTIWAEHSNTANPHLHLAVVRVDPATGQAAGTDWLIDDLHQALAIIEERQSRSREPNGLYIARDGAVFDVDSNVMVRDAHGQFQNGWYKARGRKHDKVPTKLRLLRAEIIAVADSARDWAELHAGLEELHVTYDRASSGAHMSYRGASATASQVHASLSRAKLEMRLGPFEPDLGRLNEGFEAYRHAFDTQLAELRAARAELCRRLEAWEASILAALLPGTTHIVRKAVRAEAEAAKASLSAAFKDAIARCTKHRLSEQAWISGEQPSAPPPATAPTLIFPACADGAEGSSEIGSAFERHSFEWSTQYRLNDGTPMFTDHRVIIILHAIVRSDAIDEALKIAAERWTTVTATGPADVLERIAVRAAALNIPLVDVEGKALSPTRPLPELQQPLPPEVELPRKSAQREDDPVRRARIAEAIEYLDRFEGLPLRRRKMPQDTAESGHTGPLEILVDAKPGESNSQLAVHAMFDEDPLVQQFLERKRLEELETWSVLLLRADIKPTDLSAKSLRECLPSQFASRLSARAAENDHDFLKLMEHVRKELRRRSKTAHHRDPLQTEATSPDILQPGAASRVGPELPLQSKLEGISLEAQDAWLRARALKTR